MQWVQQGPNEPHLSSGIRLLERGQRRLYEDDYTVPGGDMEGDDVDGGMEGDDVNGDIEGYGTNSDTEGHGTNSDTEGDSPGNDAKELTTDDNSEDILEDENYPEDSDTAANSPTPFVTHKYNVLSLVLSLCSTDPSHSSSLMDMPLHPIIVVVVIVICFLCLTGIILLTLRVYVLSFAAQRRYAYAQSLYTEKEKVLCKNWKDETESPSAPLVNVHEAVLNDIIMKYYPI